MVGDQIEDTAWIENNEIGGLNEKDRSEVNVKCRLTFLKLTRHRSIIMHNEIAPMLIRMLERTGSLKKLSWDVPIHFRYMLLPPDSVTQKL